MMDRIQRLKDRVDKLEKAQHVNEYPNDKPKLATSIRFAAGMALFIVGILMHWHWGWLVAIGIATASMLVMDD
jgi:fatty acid desaturase